MQTSQCIASVKYSLINHNITNGATHRADGRAFRTPWPGGGLTYAQGSHARYEKKFLVYKNYTQNIK